MKFKIGDKVKVLKHAPYTTTASGSVPYSFNYGYIGDEGVIRYVGNSERPYEVEFVNDNKLWFKDNGALELVAEKPAFNLEQFKKGVPALTRDGRVAMYSQMQGEVLVIKVGVDTCYSYASGLQTAGGNYENKLDLVGMKVVNEVKPPEHQKPSKSLDEKRYEWLKRYSMAGASIKEVEDAKTYARNGKEFDAVIDKYSVLISFNKP